MKQSIENYFRFLNAEQWDDLGALFAVDGTVNFSTESVTGRDEVTAAYRRRVPSRYPHHVATPRTIADNIDYGFALLDLVVVTPAGREVTFAVVDVFRFEDGKITNLDIIYDRTATSAN
ncbi:nuclear transport factor 2 family protein [Aeromicrobium sp.]|uniref:nuclear transport factor 2 family protein n=1 Tax=Aeromicrobium sp. TaxID=1871063 RepID=UPI0019BFB081|nr:nuclear transport factor 2 family protein [Aeromicrobium sp.]MBC7633366.1 nuclear transport factor 2 family protein [Aeromicrobium sp.]